MANIPDFSYEDKTPYGDVFNALANKPVKEQQMDLAAEENRRKRAQFVIDAAKAGADMAATAVATAAARQKIDFDKLNNPLVLRDNQNKVVSGTIDVDAKNRQNDATKELPQVMADAELAKYPQPATQEQYGKANAVKTAAAVVPDKAAESFFPKQVVGGKTTAPRTFTLPDGNEVSGYYSYEDRQNHYFDPKTGEDIVIGGAPPAFAPKLVPNAGGGVNLVPNVAGTSSSTAVEPLDPKTGTKKTWGAYETAEQNRIDDEKKSLVGDSIYTNAKSKVADIGQARKLLNANNWVANAANLSVFAKTLGRESGVLSNQDQNRLDLSPQITRRILTKASRWATGDIRAEDRADFAKALDISEAANQKIANVRLDVHTSSVARRTRKGDKEFIKSILSGEDSTDEKGSADATAQALDILRSSLKKRQ